MTETIILGAISIIFAIIFCVFRAKQANVFSLMLKTISSICFILCGLLAIQFVGSSTINLLIIAGLVLGLIGDIVLDLKVMYNNESDSYFLFGTLAFVVGHIFYFTATLLHNINILPANVGWNILASFGVAILLSTIILLSSKKMKMNFGKFTWLVSLYSLILTFMTAFSISIAIFSPMFWIFASGMIAFLLSDLVLSMQYFGGRNEKILIYVNHILYYIAQVLLAISILFI